MRVPNKSLDACDCVEDLARAARGGDVSARNKLVEANIPLAISIAARFSRLVPQCERDDIVSEALMGLTIAMGRFDPSLSSLGTYATSWCRERILGYLWDRTGPVRRPRWLSVLRKVAAEDDGARRAATRAACEQAERGTVRIDADSQNGGCDPEDPRPGPDLAAEAAEDCERMATALDSLEPWERYVFAARHGLYETPASLSEIALAAGISSEWVRKTEHRAAEKLRRRLDPESRSRYAAPIVRSRARERGSMAVLCGQENFLSDAPASA